ncbi:MAG: hypothetical protein PHN22_04515 [Candidatus ainarchaeum sp.]|nr:hypothetical protein [Candidatus ainarchaeum sp.]
MDFVNFESDINTITTTAGYIDAIKNGIVPKIFKYRLTITDHDVIGYIETKDKIIILEIQCKDQNEYNSTQLGTIDGYKSEYGFFTSGGNNLPQFRRIHYTENNAFFDWITDYTNVETDVKPSSPLNQIIKSSIHTVYCFSNKFKNQKTILVFPIICISNQKINSAVYVTKLKYEQFTNPAFKRWITETYKIKESEINFNGQIPIILCNKEGLIKILEDIKCYKDKIRLALD